MMNAVEKLHEKHDEKYKGLIDISIDEYHSCPGISRSMIMSMKQTPYHYWHANINPNAIKKEPSDAMVLGNAVHTYCLEENKFNDRYIIMPKVDRRTSDGKKQYADFLLEAEGRTVIDEINFNQIKAMKKSIMSNSQARDLLANQDNLYEQSIFWRDDSTGLLCKARPDILCNDFIIDLKTTKNAHPRKFQNDVYSNGYYLQAAMLHESLKHGLDKELSSFLFLAVESFAPYATAIYILDESAIQQGIEEFHRLLGKIKDCEAKGVWPSYQAKIITLPNFTNYIDIEE